MNTPLKDVIDELRQIITQKEDELKKIAFERDWLLQCFLDNKIHNPEYTNRILFIEEREIEIQIELKNKKDIIDSFLM